MDKKAEIIRDKYPNYFLFLQMLTVLPREETELANISNPTRFSYCTRFRFPTSKKMKQRVLSLIQNCKRKYDSLDFNFDLMKAEAEYKCAIRDGHIVKFGEKGYQLADA